MKIQDLIPGNIYYIEQSGRFGIFKYKNQQKFGKEKLDPDRVNGYCGIFNFNEGNLKFDPSQGNCWVSGRGLREATPEEQYWLNECIKEGKLMPRETLDFSKINPNYEIY